jgi:hypothetical protein
MTLAGPLLSDYVLRGFNPEAKMRYQRTALGLAMAGLAGWSANAADILREPAIGMSQIEAAASNWCQYRDKHQTTTATSNREQWVCYTNENRIKAKGYLYFDGGILTAIQN